MIVDKQTNSLDYMKALDILYPYKVILEKIHATYLDACSDTELKRNMDQTILSNNVLDSLKKSKLNIESLVKELSSKIRKLDFSIYCLKNIKQIEEVHGVNGSYDFNNGTWELKDVYHYLLHIFKDENYVLIKKNIINGNILSIVNCLFIRI